MPDQYRPERIVREDVQRLLRKVVVVPIPEFSARFPNEMPCRITVHLRGGRVVATEKRDYEGFHTRPMSWEAVTRKFDTLASPYAAAALRKRIATTVRDLENRTVADLMKLLAGVSAKEGRSKR